MDRRTLLKFVAALGLSTASLQDVRASGLRIVVAGAGIVGAAVAYHLAKAGAAVTVIDRQGPATHASRASFAWINATWAKKPRHYHRLSQDSVGDWDGLGQSLGIPIRWGGSLEWFEDANRQIELAGQIAEQAAWGEPARMLEPAEFSSLEPDVCFGDVEAVAFSGNDGAVDPIVATRTLLSAAEQHGARLCFPCDMTGVLLDAGRLSGVQTSAGRFRADRLVLATGADAEAGLKLADWNIPQRSTPGFIVITAPMPRMLNRVLVAPGVHVHQRDDGRVVLGEQDGAPQNDAHRSRLADRPNDFPNRQTAREHAERLVAIAARYLPDLALAKFEDVPIGWRPLPLDGHPVIGASPARPDVYFMIMHSGVTLAPIVGELAAYELINGDVVARLEDYRPEREFQHVERY